MILSLTTKGFSPLTYDEIIAPLKTYTDEYNTVADKLAQIQTNSSFGDYADALKGDSSAYSTKLTNFENKLSNAADELSKYGISKVNRTSLIDLKKEYNNEVAPIIAAAKQKKKILDKLNVYNLSRPDKGTMVLSSMDLSNWINDPEYVPKIISVKDNIYSPTKSIVEAWSKEFEPRTYLRPLENGQMTKYVEKGFPQETINGISNFFTNGTSGNEQLDTQLHTVINNVLDSIGYNEDTFKDLDPMKQKQIMSSIAQAFNDGISKSSGINASIGRDPSQVFPTAAQLYGSARSGGSSSNNPSDDYDPNSIIKRSEIEKSVGGKRRHYSTVVHKDKSKTVLNSELGDDGHWHVIESGKIGVPVTPPATGQGSSTKPRHSGSGRSGTSGSTKPRTGSSNGKGTPTKPRTGGSGKGTGASTTYNGENRLSLGRKNNSNSKVNHQGRNATNLDFLNKSIF